MRSEEESLNWQNSISGTYPESGESKFVEQHCQRHTQIDISLTHSHIHSLIHSLTHSTEWSPCRKAEWFSANQEVPRILCNPKVQYHISKWLSSVPIFSHINLFHAPHSIFLKIHLNIIYQFTPWSSQLLNCHPPVQNDHNSRIISS